MARKTFATGQQVEVWRRVFGRWDPGTYDRPSATPGRHWVRISGGMMEFATRSVRIRKATP